MNQTCGDSSQSGWLDLLADIAAWGIFRGPAAHLWPESFSTSSEREQLLISDSG